MWSKFLIVWLFIISSFLLKGQGDNDGFKKALNNINQSVLKAQLGFLASDWTEGREAGEKGEYLASEYIASMLQLYGVKPGGDYPRERGYANFAITNERSYFQNFILIKTSPGDEQIMKIKTSDGNNFKSISFAYNVDFWMRPADHSIEIDAPVVFVGYGFRSEKLKHDDFSKIDLKGKFILKLSGSPGYAKALLSPSELSSSVKWIHS
jgi:hypothetical protein